MLLRTFTLRRRKEIMDIWYRNDWVTMDDLTGYEWDEYENFEPMIEREADYTDFLIWYERSLGLDEVIDYD